MFRTVLRKTCCPPPGNACWWEDIPFHPFNHLLSSSASLFELERTHALLVKNGLQHDPVISSKLVTRACSFASTMEYPRKLFELMPERDVFLWNTVIRGYSDAGPCQEVLVLYREMCFSGMAPDKYTFSSVLRSCGVLSASSEGRGVHCSIIKVGFEMELFIQNSLVAMYFQVGEMVDAEFVFGEIETRNIVSWTAMIAGYTQSGLYHKSLNGFREMLDSGIQPNAVTLVSILPACTVLELMVFGKLIHGCAVKLGANSNIIVTNALIALYGKCRNVNAAILLFDSMLAKNKESWNTMIAVCEQNDAAKSAIRLFQRMQDETAGFDYITLVSIISACANSGQLDTGRWVHKLAASKGFVTKASITNALIYMYAKCGIMDMAKDVFDSMPCKSVVTWTAMIGACASHGHGETALNLFSQMKAEGIQPNTFTFTALLTACRHSGLVEEGKKLFHCMMKEYSLLPRLEHCSCIVDLLGRSGCLVEAYEFIKQMPIEANKAVWCALLDACKLHCDFELAELVTHQLFLLDSGSLSYYIILSNIYAEAGRWEDAERLKKLMVEGGQKKVPGHSLAETC